MSASNAFEAAHQLAAVVVHCPGARVQRELLVGTLLIQRIDSELRHAIANEYPLSILMITGVAHPLTVLDALEAYEACYAPDGDSHRAQYATTLDARPWCSCTCDVCTTLGHHVILFRGAERNRRRGLHNTWTFYRRVQRQTAHVSVPVKKSQRAVNAAAGETRP